MQPYVPPIDDFRFLMEDVLGFDMAMAETGRGDIDTGLMATVLEEAGRLCRDQLQPINRIGDEEGSRLENGEVKTPTGFASAYRTFADGGWTSLTGDPAYGGQGLPLLAQLWLDEMVSATNLSFGLFPGLTHGAVEAIAAHGSDAIKSIYLPPMLAGQWSGAMALTEGGAGTDLALLTTRADANGEGSYAITGTKIFISSGDHDFGGNVVHLVLARLHDAPAGVKGISLFVVPKFLPDGKGGYAARNGMSVGSIEKKMGIHAQPTCTMHYDGATGWLIGEPHRGLTAMFTMMNAARLMVGMQGLGIASASYQQAVAYAKERKQGRRTGGAPGTAAIIEHADVRRMLLTIRSFVEAARALAGWTALQLDRAHTHPDPAERATSDGWIALLTPIIKASFTDLGFESAVAAQQVFGGHGYIREWGMEQYVRDARIAQIYEGTNGIQALDLVGRKLGLDGGNTVDRFLVMILRDLDTFTSERIAAIAGPTRDAVMLLRSVTDALRDASVDTASAAAVDYLRLFALVAMAWMWTKMAAAAEQHDTPFHLAKLDVAMFFVGRILPQTHGLSGSILADGASVMAIAEDAF